MSWYTAQGRVGPFGIIIKPVHNVHTVTKTAWERIFHGHNIPNPRQVLSFISEVLVLKHKL